MTTDTATILSWPTEASSGPFDLVWETPPEPKSRTDNTAIALTVASRPGEWAIVRTWPKDKISNATSFARHVRSGAHAAYAAVGAFEAVARVVEEEARVYARCTRRVGAA